MTTASGKPSLWIVSTVAELVDVPLRGQPSFLKDYFDITLIADSSERLDGVGRREGVRVVGVPMTRKITPFKDLLSLWRFWRLARRERPDIIHSYTPKAGLVAMVGGRLARVPNRVHSVIGLPLVEAHGVRRWFLERAELVTYASATELLCNSIELSEYLAKEVPSRQFPSLGGGSVDGIDGAHYSPDLDYPDRRAELGIPGDATVLVFVGRVVPHKGVVELMAAFTALQNERPDVHLLVVGITEDELSPLPAGTLDLLRTGPGVHWVGYQTDVRSYLAASNVLVLPSYREGLPVVLLEAAAMELPVIVTDISGCREVVDGGRYGWIVTPKDVNALQTAMAIATDCPDEVKQMGVAARERVLADYSQASVRTELLAMYLRLTGEG